MTVEKEFTLLLRFAGEQDLDKEQQGKIYGGDIPLRIPHHEPKF